MATVVTYAVFTVACGFAPSYETLLVFRALQGLGFGGEWAVGAILVAEYATAKHQGHTGTREQVHKECDACRSPQPVQSSSTINRKPRFVHSVISCSRVSQFAGDTSPRNCWYCWYSAPANSKFVIIDAGITAMRSAVKSATIEACRLAPLETSTPILP